MRKVTALVVHPSYLQDQSFTNSSEIQFTRLDFVLHMDFNWLLRVDTITNTMI